MCFALLRCVSPGMKAGLVDVRIRCHSGTALYDCAIVCCVEPARTGRPVTVAKWTVPGLSDRAIRIGVVAVTGHQAVPC